MQARALRRRFRRGALPHISSILFQKETVSMRMHTPESDRSAQPGAIVLGGNFVGLAVVRSLAAHGIRTWVIDSDRSKSIAQFSRLTERFIEAEDDVERLLM